MTETAKRREREILVVLFAALGVYLLGKAVLALS
jgi:hypothetical protein